MSDDVDLSGYGAMEQAGSTAHDYLSRATEILKKDHEDWSVRDAIQEGAEIKKWA